MSKKYKKIVKILSCVVLAGTVFFSCGDQFMEVMQQENNLTDNGSDDMKGWTLVGYLPAGISRSAAVVQGGDIYLFGGKTASGIVGDLQKINLSTFAITQLQSGTPRTFSSLWAGSNYLWAFGGANESGALDLLDAYSITANSWTTLTGSNTTGPFATARYAAVSVQASSASADFIAFLLGGFTGTGQFGENSATFEPDSEIPQNGGDKPVWTKIDVHDVAETGGALYDGKIYCFSGKTSSGLSDALLVFDTSDESSTSLALPSSVAPRYGASVVAISSGIIVYGGSDGSTLYRETWYYNPTGNLWLKLSQGPSGRLHHCAVASDNKMYVIGGELSGSALSAEIWVYDISEDK